MLRIFIVLLISLSFCLHVNAQYKKEHIKFDSINLAPPLDIPLILAGNFGELRANHFHTGLDFKTQRVVGKKIYAVEEGWVSRVKISHWGYGKVVYVDHPNGLTSVYAHCSRFPDKLDSIIKREQIKAKNDQIEFFPKKNEIPLKKKEHFAYSGNSGSSSAPHLHFEIRETKTEHALNPLLFKCYRDKIKDHKKPNLMGFKVYAVSKEGYRIPNRSKYFTIKLIKGKMVVNNGKTVEIPANFCSKTGGIGIAFHTDDQLDGAGNHCGIYHTSLTINDTIRHQQEISHVDFSTNRYINTHMDYERYKAKRVSLHKQFSSDINQLPIYPVKNGIVKAKPGEKFNVLIEVTDVHGNKTTQKLNFSILKGAIVSDYYTSDFHQPHDILFDSNKQASVQLGTHTNYEPLKLNLITINTDANKHSNTYRFGKAHHPVHQHFDLKITPKPTADTNHLVLLRKNDKNHWVSAKGSYKNGVYHARLRYFGDFKLSVDTTAPYINVVNFKNKSLVSSKVSSLKFKLGDNLSGLASYHLYVDNKWQLLTRYRKKKYYAFDGWKSISKGKHQLKLVVQDVTGNKKETKWEITK